MAISSVARAHEAGALAWDAMGTHRIVPLPRNYELWFLHLMGDRPDLSERLAGWIARHGDPTQPVLDELYRDFIAVTASPGDAQEGGAEGGALIRQAAQEILGQLGAGQSAAAAFGAALADCAQELRRSPTAETLRTTLGRLAAETNVAAERNAALQQQLSGAIEQVTGLEQRLAAAERSATTDALTGVANRRLFDGAIRQAVVHAQETGEEFSLVLLDIDDFRLFNERYGHRMGDQVLRLIGRTLLANVKGRDTVARYGGEEFAVILPGTSLPGGRSVAEQIRKLLERRPVANAATGERLGVVTASLGVAQYRQGEPAGRLIERADQAMYRAKRSGRNRVETDAAESVIA